MNISPQDVKRIKDITGAGFGDCKKALEASGGDFELAKKKLREMGVELANKRCDVDSKEGRIFVYCDKKKAGILLMSCETDFVAINDDFVSFGNLLLKDIVNNRQDKLTENQELDVKNLAAIFKENIMVKKFFVFDAFENEVIECYVHGEQARIGVILKLKVKDSSKLEDKVFREFSKDLTLQIAAFSPIYFGNGDIPESYIKEQEEIFFKQFESTGKPRNVLKNIVDGKVKKYLSEICLLDQGFVKDDNLTVRQKLEEVSRIIESKIEIIQFKYLSIG